MRAREVHQGLTVQAVAGTQAVLLGFDFDDPTGCLGFAIHRTDHTEGEAYWLRGLKAFPSVIPHPTPGMDFSFGSIRCRVSNGGTIRRNPAMTTPTGSLRWEARRLHLARPLRRVCGCLAKPRTTESTVCGSTGEWRGLRRS
jgi:hypothetical protein